MLRKIYFALVHSNLCHLVEVWGSAAKCYLRPIQAIQNRVLKFVFGLPRLSSTLNMYLNLEENILPIKALHELSILKYVKQVMNREVHHVINFEFVGIGRQSDRVLRSTSCQLFQPNIRTEIGRR